MHQGVEWINGCNASFPGSYISFSKSKIQFPGATHWRGDLQWVPTGLFVGLLISIDSSVWEVRAPQGFWYHFELALFPWPSLTAVLNAYLFQGAGCCVVSSASSGKGPSAQWGRPYCSRGSLLFSQSTLLLILPAGFLKLAFTSPDLDTSSMEAYFMNVYFLSEASSVCHCRNTETASSERAHCGSSPQAFHVGAPSTEHGEIKSLPMTQLGLIPFLKEI